MRAWLGNFVYKCLRASDNAGMPKEIDRPRTRTGRSLEDLSLIHI
jgi:hypothetical protein